MKTGKVCLCIVAMSIFEAVLAILFELALIIALAAAIVNESPFLTVIFAACSLLFTIVCCSSFRMLAGGLADYRRNRILSPRIQNKLAGLRHRETAVQGYS